MRITSWISFLGILVFALGCENKNLAPEDYPIIPYVEFRDLKFIAGNINNSIADTLRLKFYLRDGDSDLGLDSDNSSPPYNVLYVLNRTNGQLIAVNDIPKDHSNLVTYSDRKSIDTLPPIGCSRWRLSYNMNSFTYDTIYLQNNPNAWNAFVSIYIQDSGTQSWKLFDPTQIAPFPNCFEKIEGRFPSLPFQVWGPFKFHALSAKEGIMTYAMQSMAYKILFSGKTIKLQFSIQDRALHRSNVVETPEIQI